jgi:hypothetical protein
VGDFLCECALTLLADAPQLERPDGKAGDPQYGRLRRAPATQNDPPGKSLLV